MNNQKPKVNKTSDVNPSDFSNEDRFNMAHTMAKYIDWCQRMQDKYPQKFKKIGIYRPLDRAMRTEFKIREHRRGGEFEDHVNEYEFK